MFPKVTDTRSTSSPERRLLSADQFPMEAVPNQAFRSVLDGVPGAWFFTRRDGTFAYTNVGASVSLGYTRDELMARTIFDIDPTLTQEQWGTLFSGTRPRDPVTLLSRHRRKDGSEFPVEVRASRVQIEGDELAVAYTVDLTQNEKTQDLNRRLLAAIEQANDAVVVTDAAGVVEYVNPAYERSTGFSSSEVRGRPWALLENAADAGFLDNLERVLASGTAHQARIQSRRRSGERYDEQVSISPIRDDGGKVSGWVAVKRDVTEQLRLEEQLRQAQRIETVGQLAGGVAHDFNNLLQVIHGQTHLIQMEASSESLEPMLGEINKAVERASSLIRQLLAFSRKGTVEFSELRPDELITALSGMLKRLLGEHIELDWQSSAAAAFVRGNAPQLEQVVANLCVNARDAMPNGGRLTMRLTYAELDRLPEGAHNLGSRPILLTVSDVGTGMPPGVLERAFEPFFTTKAPGRGTGLGLATVHAIVQGHGGFIEVDSHPGAGTTFRIYLPTVEARTSAPAKVRRSRKINGKNRLALVAEDEPAVCDLTAAYLRQSGFRVLVARDGVEAERLLEASQEEVSVLVLDAVMPRRGGRAVHDALRAKGDDTPIVFVTGYDYESLALAVHQENVAILQKPFSEDELLSQVAAALNERTTLE